MKKIEKCINEDDLEFDNDLNDQLNDQDVDNENDNQLLKDLNTNCEVNILSKEDECTKDDKMEDNELLNLTKEEIIEIKNYKILKLKTYIKSLEKEKQDLINDYKLSTDALLEKIKQLEYNKFGYRPETPAIARNILNKNKEFLIIKNNKNNDTISNIENKKICPNCSEQILECDYFQHSLECLRKKYKCIKCGILMDVIDKEKHIELFLNTNKIKEAIINRDTKYIQLAIEHGFNANTVIINENTGNYLLHELAKYDLIFCILKELNGYLNINVLNKNNETPLMVAIINKNVKSCKDLILQSSDILQRNKADMSPLMLCCQYNLGSIAEMIIKKGVNVNEKNILGDTPLKIAQKNNNEKLAFNLIKKYKADVGFK